MDLSGIEGVKTGGLGRVRYADCEENHPEKKVFTDGMEQETREWRGTCYWVVLYAGVEWIHKSILRTTYYYCTVWTRLCIVHSVGHSVCSQPHARQPRHAELQSADGPRV